MKTVIVYPVPLDTPEVWQTFKPFVERFCRSFREYPPLGGAVVQPVFCNDDSYEATELLELIPEASRLRPMFYAGGGCDIGCAQLVADSTHGNPFLICMTTRCYFHRAQSVSMLVEARQQHGPGLYGCSASHEGGRLHLCTRAYALDAEDLRAYPHRIIKRGGERGGGTFFETGANNPDGNLLEWMERRGRPGRLVFWDGVREKPDWFTVPNRFRNGDQSAMLVHDLHTDTWKGAPADQKKILSQWSDGTPI